jgi:hypothetical protein
MAELKSSSIQAPCEDEKAGSEQTSTAEEDLISLDPQDFEASRKHLTGWRLHLLTIAFVPLTMGKVEQVTYSNATSDYVCLFSL